MTPKELETVISKYEKELADLRESRGSRYAGNVDRLRCLRDFGWYGCLCRIGDKYHRLRTMSQGTFVSQANCEPTRDSILDLINYGLYMLILFDQETKTAPQLSDQPPPEPPKRLCINCKLLVRDPMHLAEYPIPPCPGSERKVDPTTFACLRHEPIFPPPNSKETPKCQSK